MKSTVKNYHFIVALMLFFCFSSESVFGQEWQKNFSTEIFIEQVIETSDSSIWILGDDENGGGNVFFKLDKNGNVQFKKKWDIGFLAICKSYDNGIFISRSSPSNTDTLKKIDKNGNVVWAKAKGFSFWIGEYEYIRELPNKNIFIVGDTIVYLFDENGIQLKKAKIPQYTDETDIFYADNQKIIIVGKNQDNDLIESQFDYNLNVVKTTIIAENYISDFWSTELPIVRSEDGAYYLPEYGNWGDPKITLKKSLNGQELWKKTIFPNNNKNFISDFTDIKIDANNNIVIAGLEVTAINSDSFLTASNAAIWVLDKDGNFKSMQRFTGKDINLFFDLSITSDNYYLASGYKNFTQSTSIFDAFLVKTKAEGLNSFISGKIAIEKNTNCKADSLEQKLSGWVVESEDTKKVKSYAVSDQNGDYWLLAPSGTNTLSVQNPSPYFKQICDSTVVAKSGLSVEKDLMMSATVDCPYMTVELSTQGIRPCTTAVYVVRYCNKGAVLGKNASIKVKLDPNLTYKTSTKMGVLQADGSYLFALGDVAVNECGVFTITSDVKCDLNLVGKTLCNKAHIYPDSVCNSGNKAKIQVTGNCNAGKVDFLIKNIGKTPMPSNKNYYVIEDDVMYKQGTFQLNPNATLPVSITAKAGKTYRIIAEQSDLTLGTIASTALEACLSNPNGNSTGFVNQFPLGDDSPFKDEDCRTVVNSFDPNDKTAFPEGTKTQHFIPKNTDLDYLIRFQNSGTDTAFVVVIKDTLSAFLDPATIVPGVSSHPYRFTLTDNGVASFIFEKINLPHEKVDKEGSNGFVKFKIKQRANNPNGTIINNHAAIFFDFNLPIITNTTTNTIGENWITILASSEDAKNNLLSLKIYPNPFQENARIEIEENTYNNLIFNVLDLNGKILRSEKFSGTSLEFERGNLTEGFYIYQIHSRGTIVQTGKIIVN